MKKIFINTRGSAVLHARSFTAISRALFACIRTESVYVRRVSDSVGGDGGSGESDPVMHRSETLHLRVCVSRPEPGID